MSIFRKITETVSKGVSTATEKAQQTVEITRLHSQMSGKRKEIERLYATMGEAVFDAYLAKDLSLAESKVFPACEQIVAIRQEIEALEDRVMQIRNEKECECGKKAPFDARFCASCGHPFPEPPVQEQPLDPPVNEAAVVGAPALTEPAAQTSVSPDSADTDLPSGAVEPSPMPPTTEPMAEEEGCCFNCGRPLDDGVSFCPTCGARQTDRA